MQSHTKIDRRESLFCDDEEEKKKKMIIYENWKRRTWKRQNEKCWENCEYHRCSPSAQRQSLVCPFTIIFHSKLLLSIRVDLFDRHHGLRLASFSHKMRRLAIHPVPGCINSKRMVSRRKIVFDLFPFLSDIFLVGRRSLGDRRRRRVFCGSESIRHILFISILSGHRSSFARIRNEHCDGNAFQLDVGRMTSDERKKKKNYSPDLPAF